MRAIVQDGAEILREVAKPVPDEMFGSAKLKELIKEMSAALEAEPDGVALAAPQVSVSWRLFIVRMDRIEPPHVPAEGSAQASVTNERPAIAEVYINPEIVKTSRKRAEADEGCLSVRGIYGTTSRHERVTIRARLPDGTPLTRGAGGLLAQIFEHEVDHLNGILFTDTAENVVEITHHEHEPVA